MIATYRQAMDKGYHTNTTILSNYKPPFAVDWARFVGRHWTDEADTTVPLKRLTELAQQRHRRARRTSSCTRASKK